MSLVAYAASSSEEDSDIEHEIEPVENVESSLVSALSGHISDDDDDSFAQVEEGANVLQKVALWLPAPKQKEEFKDTDEMDESILPKFARLPMPRTIHEYNRKVVELDDEFLHKKVLANNKEKPPSLPLLPSTLAKGPVKIKIPSLKDFGDVDDELAKRGKNKTDTVKTTKGSGLLSILPKAKSEQDFSRTTGTTSNLENKHLKKISTLIPDSVKHLRPAFNTEGVDGLKLKLLKPPNKKEISKTSLVDFSDSEQSDNDESVGDFFSLNADEKLPDVSANEINIMVAKRAAKMAEATNKFLKSTKATEPPQTVDLSENAEKEIQLAQKRFYEKHLDAQAMEALVGSSAKRRRKQQEDIQVMDISSEQVLPNRDEWMRTALATSTAYQPTGVLVDEEPASGTRRKHQITYLAHKAKANEAELQAMWAANRHTRRATQSKYGF